MKILMLHNRYKNRAGEDASADAERDLLLTAGHEVCFSKADNSNIFSLIDHVNAGLATTWSREWHARTRHHIDAFRPDVVHVQNAFPIISPSAAWAARSRGVPVVQAVRNHRLACPSANLFRNGGTCLDCVGRSFKWPSIRHRCYRGRALDTLAVAASSAVHRGIGTWRRAVTRYIAVSQYCADRLMEEGIPPERIAVKPNFVTPPAGAPAPANSNSRSHFLFVGRDAPEKGADVLMSAWGVAGIQTPLLCVGDMSRPREAGNARFLGRRSPNEVRLLMNDAIALVMPGIWPEPFGRVAVEAFAAGTPVISSDLGGVAEIVTHERNGLLVPAGNAAALAQALTRLDIRREEAAWLGENARATWRDRYTPAANLAQLERIYREALGTSSASPADAPASPRLAATSGE